MAKHTKQRAFDRICPACGQTFVTGSSIKIHCSPECRVREAATSFAEQDSCWEWPASRNPVSGYGQLSAWKDGRRIMLSAHRIAYEAFVGPIPNGMQVCHSCDNTGCFNPSHLFVGTQRDNVDDMWQKGRATQRLPHLHWTKKYPERIKRGDDHPLRDDSSCLPRGTSHHNAKITEDDVREIRKSTETLDALSRRYGLSQSSLSSIRRGKTWRHVL